MVYVKWLYISNFLIRPINFMLQGFNYKVFGINFMPDIFNFVTHLTNFMLCVFSFMACVESISSHVQLILRACIMYTLCVSNFRAYIVYDMYISFAVEPFYIDHKRLNLLTKTKLFQIKLLNFSLMLIDKGAGTN